MLPIRDCVTVVGSGMLVPRPDGGWETSMRGVAADGAVERAAACPGGALRRVLGRFLANRRARPTAQAPGQAPRRQGVRLRGRPGERCGSAGSPRGSARRGVE